MSDFEHRIPKKTPLTTIEVVDTMKRFKELHNAIKAGQMDLALQLYRDVSPEITEVLEGLFEGPYTVLPEEERIEIEKEFRKIKGTNMDLIARVKLALDGTDAPKDFVHKHLKCFIENWENNNTKESLKHLGHIRDFMFPLNSEYPFPPESLHPAFLDFLDDEGMWHWIAQKERSELSDKDDDALHIIYNSVKDLIDRNAIFSDIFVEDDPN